MAAGTATCTTQVAVVVMVVMLRTASPGRARAKARWGFRQKVHNMGRSIAQAKYSARSKLKLRHRPCKRHIEGVFLDVLQRRVGAGPEHQHRAGQVERALEAAAQRIALAIGQAG